MKVRNQNWLVVFWMTAILLSSCNIGATPAPTMDVGAIQTQAFAQVMTQAAAAFTPTPMPTNTLAPTMTLAAPPTFAPIGGGEATPFAFNTPLPGLTPIALSPIPTLPGSYATITTENGCNNGIYTGESGSPYDGQYMDPNVWYEKSFTFVNTGSCAWDEGYVFAFQPGYSTEGFKGYDIPIKKEVNFTKPGEAIVFVIKLKTGVQPGTYIGSWKMRDDGGNYFGSLVYIKYVVGTRAERDATAEAATEAADD